jgi:glycosyltransferase involved in cell wall biosynthesis
MANERGDIVTTVIPTVSVIVPCRNEAGFIARCLDSILATSFDRSRLDVLVVDGRSDDGTRDIVADYAARFVCIRLLDNPKQITPAALNIGIAASRSDIIIRMDAHNIYPRDYITSLVEWLRASGADNVGGLWVTRPSRDTPVARAIALSLSHPFGVGNSYFRIGATEPRWVDNVPFGCYRRDVFDRIGLFDEDLVRNQDDELNLRLIRSGGRILLVPSIVSHYHARASLAKLWRMNFQYGYFKPLVIRKIGAVMTLRQIVPATFVTSLVVSGVLAPVSRSMSVLFSGILLAYLAANLAVAIPSIRRHGWRCAAALLLAFPTMHVGYGVGFITGVLNFLVLRRLALKPTMVVPLSR